MKNGHSLSREDSDGNNGVPMAPHFSLGTYFMVRILQLPIVDPAVEEAQDRMRHQAQNVLHQGPHVRVSRLGIGMDS
jgi:hypothetical protein